MILTGSYTIPGNRAEVFATMLSPEALRRSIPGCEKLVETHPDQYAVELKLGIAAIRGSFKGKVSLRDKTPPAQFTMVMDGAGAPGWVKGTALVRLEDAPDGTLVTYEADVTTGGLIASVGARMVSVVAKQLADSFFKKLSEQIESSAPGNS